MTTITSNGTGIVLASPDFSDPVTVAAGVTLTSATHAVYAASGTWNVTNGGTLVAGGYGVNLHAGGSVTNAAQGAISAVGRGIVVSGAAGAVSNYGSITATAVGSYGVFLAAGGAFYNGSTGVVGGGGRGALVQGAGAAITNAGTLLATDPGSAGIGMPTGGIVTNGTLALASGASNGILFGNTVGTLINSGRVSASDTLGVAVSLTSGGSVTNTASGTISSPGDAVFFKNTPGTLLNDGSIDSNGFVAVFLLNGGTVTNGAGGIVTTGTTGIGVYGLTGTVTNAGHISAGSSGVQIHVGGTLENQAGGVISGGTTGVSFNKFGGSRLGTLTNLGTIIGSGAGGVGVSMFKGGTLTNGGTIIGNGGTAVAMSGADTNLLIVEPGAVFTGAVTANATAANTLELAPGVGTGTLTSLGTSILNFGSIAFDPGASWRITGNAAAFSGPVTGFDAGDTIEVTGITLSGSSYAGGILTLTGTGGPLQISLSGGFDAAHLVVSQAGGTVDVTVACFAAGTRIATAYGAIPVEALRIGDAVRLADGGEAPVRWIGVRTLSPARHPRPRDVLPVRVRAHAFGPGQPGSDLLLSPDHAVRVAWDLPAPILIPIRYLVNGRTIVQEPVREITYYHVELPSHAVLLAEDLPCESYLDTGNRAAFANAGAAVMMHADFAPADFARAVWAERSCAELVVAGVRVAAARRRLLDLAVRRGEALVENPGLSVWVDGRRAKVACEQGGWRVDLPSGAVEARLRSRNWIPAHVMPDSGDERVLGVAVADLLLEGLPVPLDDTRLGLGWHAPETADNATPDGGAGARWHWRWTDGDAAIALHGARCLRFRIALTGRYWQAPPRRRHAPAA